MRLHGFRFEPAQGPQSLNLKPAIGAPNVVNARLTVHDAPLGVNCKFSGLAGRREILMGAIGVPERAVQALRLGRLPVHDEAAPS